MWKQQTTSSGEKKMRPDKHGLETALRASACIASETQHVAEDRIVGQWASPQPFIRPLSTVG